MNEANGGRLSVRLAVWALCAAVLMAAGPVWAQTEAVDAGRADELSGSKNTDLARALSTGLQQSGLDCQS